MSHTQQDVGTKDSQDLNIKKIQRDSTLRGCQYLNYGSYIFLIPTAINK